MSTLFSLNDIITYLSLKLCYYTGQTYITRSDYMGYKYKIGMIPGTRKKLQMYTSRINLESSNISVDLESSKAIENLLQGWRNVHHQNIRLDTGSNGNTLISLVITWVPHHFYTNCFVTDFDMLTLMTYQAIETYRENASASSSSTH